MAPGRGAGDQRGADDRRLRRDLDARGIGEAIEGAAVRGLLDVAAIDRVLEGPRRRGTKRLLVAVAPWRRYRRGIKLRSRMEARLLPLLTRARLPIPETNARLRVGGRTYEVDFLWRREKLVVETDGGRFHDNPAAGSRDSERNRALTGAGYMVPRLGWEDLRDRPGPTMSEIARLLRGTTSARARCRAPLGEEACS